MKGEERLARLESLREDATFPIEHCVRAHINLPDGCPPSRFYFEILSYYLAEDAEGRNRSRRLLRLFTGRFRFFQRDCSMILLVAHTRAMGQRCSSRNICPYHAPVASQCQISSGFD